MMDPEMMLRLGEEHLAELRRDRAAPALGATRDIGLWTRTRRALGAAMILGGRWVGGTATARPAEEC